MPKAIPNHPSGGGEDDGQERLLNLRQFSSVEDAMAKVEPGDRYRSIANDLRLAEGDDLTVVLMFFLTVISRCDGLHSAIAREIRRSNAHGVFPMIRALAETVMMLIYVNDHIQYINVLTVRASELPQDGPKRKSIQALIAYASKEAPGLKHVYAELSEITHFGSAAMWAAHTVRTDEQSRSTWSWTSAPRWRNNQAEIACAQTLELADAAGHYLREFAGRHLVTATP